MAKVHITLVGGQPVPVYHGIIATQPDKVVFIYSKSTATVVYKLKREIHISIDEQEPLSETDPLLITERANQLLSTYKDDEITLNISSGLKSWTVLFCRVFDAIPNASIVYMDQNNMLWNYRTMQSLHNFEFDMDVIFRLLGNPLTHFTPLSEYTEKDNEVLKKLIAARKYNCGNFNKLTTILTKEWENKILQNTGCLTLSDSNYVEWEKPDFVRIVLSTKSYGTQEFTMESPHAVSLAFHTHWFEYKIASMLSHWKYAKDIRLNCVFPSQGNIKSTQFPKNEIDIIVNTGTKILFVECKTQINNSTDIDKFRTAVKNYGGMGSKAIFITDNMMNALQIEKCNESGIIHFSLQDKSLAPDKEQELFKLLEQELFNINTK